MGKLSILIPTSATSAGPEGHLQNYRSEHCPGRRYPLLPVRGAEDDRQETHNGREAVVLVVFHIVYKDSV